MVFTPRIYKFENMQKRRKNGHALNETRPVIFTEAAISDIIDLMAKKAVIQTGGKQYMVSEGDVISVELVKSETDSVTFEPILIVDGDTTTVGTPGLAKATVTAEVVAADVQADKVTSIRYKAKKRVHTVRGHRQHQTTLKIVSIA